MLKNLFIKLKAWLNEDMEEAYSVKYLANEFSFIQLQNMILDGKNVDLCKKAWNRKAGIEYPFVCNNNNEVCTYIGNMERRISKSNLTIDNMTVLLLIKEKPYNLSGLNSILGTGREKIYQSIKELERMRLINIFSQGTKNYYSAANDVDKKLKLMGC